MRFFFWLSRVAARRKERFSSGDCRSENGIGSEKSFDTLGTKPLKPHTTAYSTYNAFDRKTRGGLLCAAFRSLFSSQPCSGPALPDKLRRANHCWSFQSKTTRSRSSIRRRSRRL